MPVRNDTVIGDENWDVVTTPVVPADARKVPDIPDCVFPVCGVMHQDGSSSVCRKCGRRTTMTCLKANMDVVSAEVKLRLTDNWMTPEWVCPLCSLYLFKGEDAWATEEDAAAEEEAVQAGLAVPGLPPQEPGQPPAVEEVDMWSAVRSVEDPQTRAVLEGMVQRLNEQQAQRMVEARGLQDARVPIVASWKARMVSPTMHAMLWSALKERYGAGADDSGTATSGCDHEIRVHYEVLQELIPIVGEVAPAAEAAHRILVRLEAQRLRRHYGLPAQTFWERRMQGLAADMLTDQLYRTVQGQAQHAGETQRHQSAKRRIEEEGPWANEGKGPPKSSRGRGGRGRGQGQ